MSFVIRAVGNRGPGCAYPHAGLSAGVRQTGHRGKQQHDERQEISRIARMKGITRMEAWGKLVDFTKKQLERGISVIRDIRVIRD